MQKLKRIGFILTLVVLLTSCSEYSKVLNKGTIEQQYKLATEYYEAKKYDKAIALFEKVIPGFRGKPQMERIQFMVSDAYYNTKQYSLAAYHFDRFTKNYPKSTKKEEAAFLAANSYNLDSYIYSLDQATTYEALDAMQKFIDTYPNSEKIADANQVIKDLRYKLELKAFSIAKQYYHIEDYTAAINAFDIFISDYLGTSFREEAMYYRFLAAYDLSVKSVFSKKEARLKDALKSYERLERNYPESEYLEDSKKILEDLNERLADYSVLTVSQQ